ncbi:MAG: zinc-binding dehydrogenase [Pyrinomonadaceae bacterium]
MLVHGASGGVGVASIQLARAAEMVVIGTGGTEKGRRLILEQGAHHTLDHKSPGYLNDVMPLTENRGVDIVLEMLANVNLDKDLNVLAKNGRVVVIGSRGTVEIRSARRHDARCEHLRHGAHECHSRRSQSNPRRFGCRIRERQFKAGHKSKFPLAEAARAHQAIMEPGAFGKNRPPAIETPIIASKRSNDM